MQVTDDHQPLLHHLERHYGIEPERAMKIIAEVIEFYSETVEVFVRDRHKQLQQRGIPNARGFQQIAEEVTKRPFSAETLTERQVRRIIYG